MVGRVSRHSNASGGARRGQPFQLRAAFFERYFETTQRRALSRRHNRDQARIDSLNQAEIAGDGGFPPAQASAQLARGWIDFGGCADSEHTAALIGLRVQDAEPSSHHKRFSVAGWAALGAELTDPGAPAARPEPSPPAWRRPG